MSTPIPAPRNPEQIKARLQQLHVMRGRLQAELVDRLMILDGIDRRIDQALAELTAARRPVA